MTQLVLSLFPGIGLLDRAFEEEDFAVVRGPDVIWGGDIRSFHPPADRFDGIIGGPPCQSFSTLINLVRSRGYEPRFGNLIPEYERCIAEAEPDWFLMENVAAAPTPVVPGYETHSFMLDNAWLGEEQERKRRFTFGRRGRPAEDLSRYIEVTALMLPRAAVVTQCMVNNHPAAKRRVPAVTGPGGGTSRGHDWPKQRMPTVTSVHAGQWRPKSGQLVRYSFPTACALQGLPEDFLSHAPFTSDGKLKAVANGVPLPMGRAVARAIREALGLDAEERIEEEVGR